MSNQTTLDLSQLGIASFMLCLKALAPPKKIIHVGAGRGVGDLHAWQRWNIAEALIIEADSQRTGWAKSELSERSNWKVIEAIVADTNTEVEFFQASNPDEDSFFPVKELNRLWPNIRVVQSQPCKTETLANLIEHAGFFKSADLRLGDEAPSITWLIIDCLPAESILKSAGQCLDSVGVVIARVLLAPIPSASEVGQNDTVEAYVRAVNFMPVAVFESQHPSIGYAVFVKDWSAMTATQITHFKNTLLKSQQEQVRIQNELLETKYQMQRLTLDRDTQLATIEELKFQIEVHLKEVSLAKAHLVNTELMQQEKSTKEVAIQSRQQQLQDDLLRAEAQIELIKDLVFARPAL
jgi:cellobiose-specific phosphotransferase system component IIA